MEKKLSLLKISLLYKILEIMTFYWFQKFFLYLSTVSHNLFPVPPRNPLVWSILRWPYPLLPSLPSCEYTLWVVLNRVQYTFFFFFFSFQTKIKPGKSPHCSWCPICRLKQKQTKIQLPLLVKTKTYNSPRHMIRRPFFSTSSSLYRSYLYLMDFLLFGFVESKTNRNIKGWLVSFINYFYHLTVGRVSSDSFSVPHRLKVRSVYSRPPWDP